MQCGLFMMPMHLRGSDHVFSITYDGRIGRISVEYASQAQVD
jgi:hypothetical protein